MHNVLIPTKLDLVAGDVLKEHGFNVVQDSDTDFSELIAANPETTALIVRSEKVPAEVIDQFPNLRLVVRAGAGYDNIDTKYARRKGIDVMNTPGANSNAVAEEVIALILSGYRHIVKADISTRSGSWEKKKFMGRELTDKTIGIVGMGNIGQHLVKRLQGFDNRVLTFDPVLSQSKAEELGVELTDIDTIFTESDIISLHVPENDHTRGMINASLLGKSKDGLMIINCARAGVVNEDDLRVAKEEKGLIYCNDVYPKDAAGDKTIADIADIMLPHLGASTKEANYNAAKKGADQIVSYFERGVRQNVVNSATPEGLDAEYQVLAYYLTKVAHSFLGKAPVTRIETSFYGGLDKFADNLKGPIVLGLSEEFDPAFDNNEASAFLEEKGIEFIKRKADDSKGYGKAMTIDLIEGQGTNYTRCSIRGSIAEGKPMVTRINDFDKLYFEPVGNSVLAVYDDQPGVLAKITTILGQNEINIEDIRAPHDKAGIQSMAVLLVNKPVGQDVLAAIKAEINADVVSTLTIK
ncbi:hypothetical protein BVY04_01560 [bacterium M21]|nr:hypothetical protein BVY04_01560 [bacterium M21]